MSELKLTRSTRCQIDLPYRDEAICRPKHDGFEYVTLPEAVLDALIKADIPGADNFETCAYGEYLEFLTATTAIPAQEAVLACVNTAVRAFNQLCDRQLKIRYADDSDEDERELYEEYSHIF